MRTAPAVRATLDANGPEHVLITVLYALTGAALAAWGLAQPGLGGIDYFGGSLPTGVAVVAGALLMALPGAWLARRALPRDGDHLRWDATAWTLAIRPTAAAATADLALVRVDVALDLGAWLMLRLALADGKARWQPVRAANVGPAWHGLRVALRAHTGHARAPR